VPRVSIEPSPAQPMTVCIAAICQDNTIIAAADRMMTSGDVQFESRHNPSLPYGEKIIPLTKSICVMIAGDSSLQVEILLSVYRTVSARVTAEPDNWWKVKDVALLYMDAYAKIRNDMTERQILSKFGLNHETFLARQKDFSEDFLANLTREVNLYKMPAASAIFMGIEPDDGAHIFTVLDGVDLRCYDLIGFSVIGSGKRHAASEFMNRGYHRSSNLAEALFLTYLSKKTAEIAPGVGKDTDMFFVGPALGQSGKIGDHVIEGLENIYRKHCENEAAFSKESFKASEAFVETILASAPKPETATQSSAPSAPMPPSI
jgi:hypothetical protein